MKVGRNVLKLRECDRKRLAEPIVELVAFEDDFLVLDSKKQRKSYDEILLALGYEACLCHHFVHVVDVFHLSLELN